MLYDDAILLAYDISGRCLGGMMPSVEISWFMEDKSDEKHEGTQIDMLIDCKDNYGLTYNEYSGDFQQVITLDDLFKE